MRVMVGVIILLLGISVQASENRCELLNVISLQNPNRKLTAKDKRIDYILVGKAQRRMIVFFNETPLKEYRVQLGFNPVGPKEQEGDGRTPEGVYHVNYRKSPSDYNKSLMLDYPLEKDIENAKRLGINPGKEIAIHGFPSKKKELIETLPKIRAGLDWTQGCIAVSNSEIEEIFPRVAKDTPVEICP